MVECLPSMHEGLGSIPKEKERERKPWTESDCSLAKECLGKKSLVPPVTYSHDKTTQVPFSVTLLNLNTLNIAPKHSWDIW